MATYRSSLIEALRSRPIDVGSASTVSFLPNPVVPPVAARPQRPTTRSPGVFNPPKLVMLPAEIRPPKQDIEPDQNFFNIVDAPTYYDSGAFLSTDSSVGGETGVGGQGISNDLADFGLALMAYGEAGKGLAPGSLAAGLVGSAIAGQQADAMGAAANTLADMSAVPGISTISDASGNVIGVSSPASIAEADAATFGTSLTTTEDAIAQAMADMAESGQVGFLSDSGVGTSAISDGLAVADGVGMSGFDSGGGFDSGAGGGGGGGGGCFLTTAAVEHMGQDDDGDVLNTLRKFRDQFMLKDDSKRADVAAYYKHAPQIVEAINARPDARNVYREMYETYILPAVDAIKSGDNDKAYEAYVAGVDWAMKQAANAQ